MTGIWEYPDLEGLEEYLLRIIEESKEQTIEEGDIPFRDINRLSTERLIVINEWGNGEAEIGVDPLDVIVLYDLEGISQAHLSPDFDRIARTVTERAGEEIAAEIIPPDPAPDWFFGLDLIPGSISQFEENVLFVIGTQEGNTVYDLTSGQAIEFVPDSDFENFPRIPLEILREEDEEEEYVEEEPEIEEIEEEQEPTEEEELAEKYPDIPPELRGYAKSEDELEIPSGVKETKTVEPRDPYDFEIVMATDRPNPQNLPYTVPTEIVSDVMPGIGRAIRSGMFGTGDIPGEVIPPATFPRVGVYIRNLLNFEGPKYTLEMYKDLLIYLGFVNEIYNYELRVGTYQTFREYMYVLEQIPERGMGPPLVEPMSQQQSASMGLKVIPDHPTIEGENAPWLQNRQYYKIVEENKDNDAWEDPYGVIHTSEDEG